MNVHQVTNKIKSMCTSHQIMLNNSIQALNNETQANTNSPGGQYHLSNIKPLNVTTNNIIILLSRIGTRTSRLNCRIFIQTASYLNSKENVLLFNFMHIHNIALFIIKMRILFFCGLYFEYLNIIFKTRQTFSDYK